MLDFDFTFFNSWCGGGDEVVVVVGFFAFCFGGGFRGEIVLLAEQDGLVEMTFLI